MRLLDRLLSKEPSFEVVTDLDAIMTRTVGFKFEGRIHKIPPLPVESFLYATNALAKIESLRKKDKLTATELLKAYEELFAIMCPTITIEHIKKMSHHQVGSLFNTILEIILGKAELTAQKKNITNSMEQVNKAGLSESGLAELNS